MNRRVPPLSKGVCQPAPWGFAPWCSTDATQVLRLEASLRQWSASCTCDVRSSILFLLVKKCCCVHAETVAKSTGPTPKDAWGTSGSTDSTREPWAMCPARGFCQWKWRRTPTLSGLEVSGVHQRGRGKGMPPTDAIVRTRTTHPGEVYGRKRPLESCPWAGVFVLAPPKGSMGPGAITRGRVTVHAPRALRCRATVEL